MAIASSDAGQRDQDHKGAQHHEQHQGRQQCGHQRHHGETKGAKPGDIDALGAAGIELHRRSRPSATAPPPRPAG